MSEGQTTTVDDVIWGSGGAKTAEWLNVGAWVGGVIQARPRTYHAKEYIKGQPGGGKPKFYPSGDPVMGIKVDVQTNMRDPAEVGDDGVRRMHLEKWRQLEAVRNALRDADVRGLEPGGELWVQWTGEEADEGQGGNPAKTWVAKYRPPVTAVPPTTGTRQAPPVSTQPPGWEAASAPQAPQSPAPVAQPAPAPYVPPTPVQAPVQQAYPADPYAHVPVQQAPAPAVPPAQMPPSSVPPATNVITAAVAAALRAQGVDTSAFTIVP